MVRIFERMRVNNCYSIFYMNMGKSNNSSQIYHKKYGKKYSQKCSPLFIHRGKDNDLFVNKDTGLPGLTVFIICYNLYSGL